MKCMVIAVDFAQQQEAAFDKWLRASEMQDFKEELTTHFWQDKSSGQVEREGHSE